MYIYGYSLVVLSSSSDDAGPLPKESDKNQIYFNALCTDACSYMLKQCISGWWYTYYGLTKLQLGTMVST